MQEVLDALETQAVGSGGGALAVGGDQLGDVALIDAVWGHTGLVSATV
jgi:hypothetical protein